MASEGPNRCDTIYQGFAECLIRLGDGMGRGGELQTVCRYQQVVGNGSLGGINPICAIALPPQDPESLPSPNLCALTLLTPFCNRSWNDFHACASRVLSGCPEEAAAVWESLQQEARRAPHPDNLHILCGAPVSVRERIAGPETNQETLRARAPVLAPAPAPALLAAALALACLLGPLA